MKQKVQVWIHRSGSSPTSPQVLIFLTHPDRGGFWQPVTGGVEKGEEPLEAALREAREESGLEFTAQPESLDFEFTYKRDGKTHRESTFSLQAPASTRNREDAQNVRLDPREHTDYRWVQPGEALRMLKHESNAEALRKFLEKFSQRLDSHPRSMIDKQMNDKKRME